MNFHLTKDLCTLKFNYLRSIHEESIGVRKNGIYVFLCKTVRYELSKYWNTPAYTYSYNQYRYIQKHFLMFRHSNTGYYWNTLMISLISRQGSSWGYDCDKNITFHHNHYYISPLPPVICIKIEITTI